MKVVINNCYGGFSLSLKAQKRLAELMGKEIYFYKQIKYLFQDGEDEYVKITNLDDNSLLIYSTSKDLGDTCSSKELNDNYYRIDIDRNSPILIQVIKELGEDANGKCSKLKIVEIPDDVEFQIEEYDGNEWIAEKHRTWN